MKTFLNINNTNKLLDSLFILLSSIALLSAAVAYPSEFFYGVVLKGLLVILAAMAIYMIFFIFACVLAKWLLFRFEPTAKIYNGIIRDYIFSYSMLSKVGYKPLYIIPFAIALRAPVFLLHQGDVSVNYYVARVASILIMIVSFIRMVVIIYHDSKRIAVAEAGDYYIPVSKMLYDQPATTYTKVDFAAVIKELKILSKRVMNGALSEKINKIIVGFETSETVFKDDNETLDTVQTYALVLTKVIDNYNDLKYFHQKNPAAEEMMQSAVDIIDKVSVAVGGLDFTDIDKTRTAIKELKKLLPV